MPLSGAAAGFREDFVKGVGGLGHLSRSRFPPIFKLCPTAQRPVALYKVTKTRNEGSKKCVQKAELAEKEWTDRD